MVKKSPQRENNNNSTWDPTSTLRAFFTLSIGIFSEDDFAQMEHLPLSLKNTG